MAKPTRRNLQEVAAINTPERDRLFKLLKHYSSLAVVSLALKAKGVPHSAGTWDELIEKRLLPSIKDGKINRSDLVAVLRDVEEYGGQNVFLYGTTRQHAAQLTDASHIRQQLRKLEREDLLDNPPILDQPKALTLSDVRVDGQGQSATLVVKAIEGRSYRQLLGEEREGDIINRRYKVVEERAVNVLRVRSDGFTELRIQSHRNTSDYVDDINGMWSLCNPIVDALRFKRLSVGKVKEYLWERRKQLQSKIRYADSRCRNAAGSVLTLASGSEQASLYDDEGSTASVDVFVKHDGAYDRSDVFWLKGTDGAPSRELHTIFDGAVNQFTVTMSCSRTDFEWVLSEIRRFNES